MKYAVFVLFLLTVVPVMAALAWYSEKARGWLLAALIATPVLGDHGNIHLLSVETYRGPDRGFEVTLADLVALALAIGVTLRKPARIAWLPYNTGLMALCLALALLSILDAPQGLLASFTIVKVMRGFLVYWTVVNTLRVGVPLRSIWRGWLAVGMGLAVYALYQKYGQGLYRVHTSFDHSNTVPLFLNQGIPILLVLGLSARWLSAKASLLTLVTVVGMLLTVVMTFSRAGMVLALMGVMGVLWVANRKAKSARVTAASLAVVAGLALGGVATGKNIVERFLEAPEASQMARDEFNRAARAMAHDHPLGVGVNQFSYVLTNTPAYSRHILVMANEKQKGVCHQVYWLTAAEMGWIGLVVFVLVILRFLWKASFEALRRPGFEGLLQAGIALGMLALHLAGFLEWVFRISPIFFEFLICAGLSVGLADSARWRLAPPAPAGAGGQGKGTGGGRGEGGGGGGGGGGPGDAGGGGGPNGGDPDEEVPPRRGTVEWEPRRRETGEWLPLVPPAGTAGGHP